MFRGGMGGNIDRDFGRTDMAMNRGFGDSFGRMGMALGKLAFFMELGIKHVASKSFSQVNTMLLHTHNLPFPFCLR